MFLKKIIEINILSFQIFDKKNLKYEILTLFFHAVEFIHML